MKYAHFIKPMLAKVADEPFDSNDWIFEIKFDGYRIQARLSGGKVSLSAEVTPDGTLQFRIADTGIDPIPHMLAAKQILGSRPKAQLLWASTRELLNIFHAEESSCDIITVPNEFLSKLDLVDKDLAEYSRETVQLFYRDATAAAYQIKTTRVAAE